MGPPIEISIVVPCYNEAENVIELAERAQAMFAARGVVGEVVFVNDASTDHTGALIDELAANNPYVLAVHHTTNRQIPGGWDSGSKAARGRYIAIMDGDLQNLPEDVYRLYRQIKYSNADIVQAWRSHIGRPRDFRYTMSRVLHYMLRVLFGLHLHDIKSGFLICDREIFRHILRHRFAYHYFQTFIAISAAHKGYRIEEIESLFEERKLGESFIARFPFKMIMKNLVDVAKGFVEFRLLGRRTDVLGDFLAQHPIERPPEVLPLWRRLYLRLFASLMPLHHWKLSSAALRYFYQLRRMQWLRADEIRALQEERLRALISHAYRHVPYYREMFDRLGIDPSEIRSIDDLQRLPPLSKDIVRRTLHFDLMSDAHDKRQMLPIRTSGATGEPLTLYAEKAQLEMRWASALRNAEWTGYRFGDRQLRVWEMRLGRPRLQALREWLDGWLARRAVVPGIALDADGVRSAAEQVRRCSGALVSGDVAALQTIGAALAVVPRARGPRAVIASEATLPPAARAAIETAFGAPVYDNYGSREFGTIAHECDAHGQHVNAESYIVEILAEDGRPARPGEAGDVVVTDLTNLCVPLIRYAIGDRATATDRTCPCGRGLPLLESIHGRPAAMFVTGDGRHVPAGFFGDVLRDAGHVVRQFAVTQAQPGTVQLRIVKGPRFSEVALQRVLDLISAPLGERTAIEVETVEAIAPSDAAPLMVRVPTSTPEALSGEARAAAAGGAPRPVGDQQSP